MKVAVKRHRPNLTRRNRGGATNCFELVCGHYAYFPVSRGTPKTAWCKTCRRVHGPECDVTKTGGELVPCTCSPSDASAKSGNSGEGKSCG
jgi:hypothetical protein